MVQELVNKTIPQKKKCNKAKWLSKEALEIAEKRKEVKGKGEKERYTYLGEGNGTPLQYSCLENPMDRGT